MKRLFCSLVLATSLAIPSIAAGAQNALERARILFDAGVQAYTTGRYNEAVESFKEAYILSDKPQALFSLAQAERRLYVVTQDTQYLRDAIEHFRKYLQVVTDGGRRGDAAEALEQLDVMAARQIKLGETTNTISEITAGKILISTTTPGAVITIDGGQAIASPALAVVAPGKHLVRVSAPGYVTENREITSIEKNLVPVEISLKEEPAYLSVSTPQGALVAIDGQLYGEAPLRKRIEMRGGTHTVSVTLAGHVPRRTTVKLEAGKTNSLQMPLDTTRRRVISYVLLGAASVGFVGAGVQGIFALREESAGQTILRQSTKGNITQAQLEEYNTSLNARDGLRNSTLFTFAGAGVLGLAGAITYIYDTQRTSVDMATNRDSVAFSVTLTPSQAGLGIGGRF